MVYGKGTYKKPGRPKKVPTPEEVAYGKKIKKPRKRG